MNITRCDSHWLPVLTALLRRYGLCLKRTPSDAPIPGSFFGDEEAGLIGNAVFVRPDTPLHSVLHEAGHYICMDPQRRSALHTDAQGDYDEENAVCYLQIVLADQLPGFSAQRMMQEMDSWGYSFRLGSAQAWFTHDAADARTWLMQHALLSASHQPTWHLRQSRL